MFCSLTNREKETKMNRPSPGVWFVLKLISYLSLGLRHLKASPPCIRLVSLSKLTVSQFFILQLQSRLAYQVETDATTFLCGTLCLPALIKTIT